MKYELVDIINALVIALRIARDLVNYECLVSQYMLEMQKLEFGLFLEDDFMNWLAWKSFQTFKPCWYSTYKYDENFFFKIF
jgi:hypothetical protein